MVFNVMRKVLLLFVLTIFVGCTTTKFVPVESVRVDSVYIAKVERDSIYERDSVFVTMKADTVFLSRVQYKYRDRYVRDTVSVMHSDTITKVVEVERRLTFWQQKKIEFGGAAILVALFLAGIIILKR